MVGGVDVLQRLDLGDHEGLGLGIAHQAHAAHAFGEDKAALVGHAHDFVHRGQGSDGMQIGGLGRVQARVELRRDHDGPFLAQRFDQLNGAFPAHGQRQHGVGKQDCIANRQNGDPARSRGVLLRWSLEAVVWMAGLALSVLVSTFLH